MDSVASTPNISLELLEGLFPDLAMSQSLDSSSLLLQSPRDPHQGSCMSGKIGKPLSLHLSEKCVNPGNQRDGRIPCKHASWHLENPDIGLNFFTICPTVRESLYLVLDFSQHEVRGEAYVTVWASTNF